ncbi:MAG: metallophosphoesterase, partial [Chthoniobacterales bacterium]
MRTRPLSALICALMLATVPLAAAGNRLDRTSNSETTPLTPPSVDRGPYLQQNRASGVTLRWRTDVATDSVVWTGAAPGMLTISATDATITTEHEIPLSGLAADASYFYAVGSSSGMLAGNDANHFFRTAPVPGTDRPMHIWVLGDCGTASAGQVAVRDAYYGSASYQFNDIMLLLGDNAYNTGTQAEYQNAIFNMYPTVLRQSPVWSCLGNHETAQATSGIYPNVPYFQIFSFPTAAECGGYPSGTERYFSWDFGNVHFISLDTQTTDPTLRTNMLAWLDNDLAANTRRWTIGVWHHPTYTKGSHDSDTEGQLIWARENLLPRLEGAGVDLVLSGHSHSYERSKFIDGFYATPTLGTSGAFKDAGSGRDGAAYGKDYGPHNGVVYAVPGSSGQISGGSLNHPVMFTSLNTLGSLVLDITGNRVDAKFITSTGTVGDYFTIEKGPLVTVSTPAPEAAEFGPVVGQIRVARSGSTAAPLAVQAMLGGSAPLSRYAPITLPVTIPTGAAFANVNVTPQPDSIPQGSQTVTLMSNPNVAYRLEAPAIGAVTIADTPPGAPPIVSAAMDYDYDVVIIGGAFSGAATALMIKRQHPTACVLVIEKAEEFDRKVGESTTEVSSAYMTRILGLSTYLGHHHIVKQGLRMWFSNRADQPFDDCVEVGARYQARLPTFQVDRSTLDAHMLEQAVAAGCALRRPAKVTALELGGADGSHVSYTIHGSHETVRARWIVDASGRAALL